VEGENEFVFCKKNDLSFKKFEIKILLLMKYLMKKFKKQKRKEPLTHNISEKVLQQQIFKRMVIEFAV